MNRQEVSVPKEKKLTLIYNGWQEINGRWFKSSLANLDLDTAYMIEKNNLVEEEGLNNVRGN